MTISFQQMHNLDLGAVRHFKTTVSGERVNFLILSVLQDHATYLAAFDKIRLTITYRQDGKNEPISQDVNIRALQFASQIIETFEGGVPASSVIINLGDILLDGDEELTITGSVDLSTVTPVGDGNLGVFDLKISTVTTESKPSHYLTYDNVNCDLGERKSFNDADLIVLYTDDVSSTDNFLTAQRDVVVESDGRSNRAPLGDYSLMTGLQYPKVSGGKYSQTKLAAVVYDSDDAIPDDVIIQVSSTNDSLAGAKPTDFLVVRNNIIAGQVSDQQKKELEKEAKKVEDLERKNPVKAQALRHAGVISTAEETAVAAESLKSKSETLAAKK